MMLYCLAIPSVEVAVAVFRGTLRIVLAIR